VLSGLPSMKAWVAFSDDAAGTGTLLSAGGGTTATI